MGRLRIRRLGAGGMAPCVPSLSGSQAGGRGSGGCGGLLEGETKENALIVGASLSHPL